MTVLEQKVYKEVYLTKGVLPLYHTAVLSRLQEMLLEPTGGTTQVSSIPVKSVYEQLLDLDAHMHGIDDEGGAGGAAGQGKVVGMDDDEKTQEGKMEEVKGGEIVAPAVVVKSEDPAAPPKRARRAPPMDPGKGGVSSSRDSSRDPPRDPSLAVEAPAPAATVASRLGARLVCGTCHTDAKVTFGSRQNRCADEGETPWFHCEGCGGRWR